MINNEHALCGTPLSQSWNCHKGDFCELRKLLLLLCEKLCGTRYRKESKSLWCTQTDMTLHPSLTLPHTHNVAESILLPNYHHDDTSFSSFCIHRVYPAPEGSLRYTSTVLCLSGSADKQPVIFTIPSAVFTAKLIHKSIILTITFISAFIEAVIVCAAFDSAG